MDVSIQGRNVLLIGDGVSIHKTWCSYRLLIICIVPHTRQTNTIINRIFNDIGVFPETVTRWNYLAALLVDMPYDLDIRYSNDRKNGRANHSPSLHRAVSAAAASSMLELLKSLCI